MNNARELILIIDMQEGFRSKESEMILPKIKILLKSFQGKIIFSKFINNKNSSFEKLLNWKKFQKKNEQELLKELRSKNNKEIRHSTYTVLTNELKKIIKKNKIKKVFVCGVYTDVCIIKTAMDLFDNNIETLVIKDACCSLHGIKNHKTALDSLNHIIGKDHILSTNEIIKLYAN